MAELKRRFKVQYSRPDGNVCSVTYGNGEVMPPLYGLRFAQTLADIERADHKLKGWTSYVFITDLENPERGDLTGVDPDEYEQT